MRMRAVPDKAAEVAKNVTRQQNIKGYPPMEEFLHAYVSERLGDPSYMQQYLATCREAINRRQPHAGTK